jgi:hypothetical protein
MKLREIIKISTYQLSAIELFADIEWTIQIFERSSEGLITSYHLALVKGLDSRDLSQFYSIIL